MIHWQRSIKYLSVIVAIETNCTQMFWDWCRFLAHWSCLTQYLHSWPFSFSDIVEIFMKYSSWRSLASLNQLQENSSIDVCNRFGTEDCKEFRKQRSWCHQFDICNFRFPFVRVSFSFRSFHNFFSSIGSSSLTNPQSFCFDSSYFLHRLLTSVSFLTISIMIVLSDWMLRFNMT